MTGCRIVRVGAVCVGIASLAVAGGAANDGAPKDSAAGLTPERTKAAQAIVTETCNACHASKKPLNARLFQKHAPAKMAGHFKKKAELTDEQVNLMVQYLSAVRDGKAELPKAAAAPEATGSSAKSGKQGKHEED